MNLTKAPIFRMYRLTVAPDDRQSFVKEGNHNMLTSHQNESGTLAMYATNADEGGTINYIFELYKDLDSYQVHANSPQFKQYGQLAQKVLKEREMRELTPEYLMSKPTAFAISGENDYVGQLLEFQLKENTISQFEKQLPIIMKQLIETDNGPQISYAATTDESKEHWILLNVYPDQASLKADTSILEPLNDLITVQNSQQLQIDTMVGQSEIQYNF